MYKIGYCNVKVLPFRKWYCTILAQFPRNFHRWLFEQQLINQIWNKAALMMVFWYALFSDSDFEWANQESK